MRRRLLAALLGGAVLTAGLAGCGIPDNSDVQVDGPGPAAESGSYNGGGLEPPTRTASDDPKEFIENYLSAAAGEREQAYDRVKDFIAPEAQSRLRKKQSSEITLTVVRPRDDPKVQANSDGTSVATVEVQQLGVLRADGTLAPPVASETEEYKFHLRPANTGDPGLLLTDLPRVLLLSDEALREYYTPHTIYFWNSDENRLVPDQRYLPSAAAERRVTEVVRWLTGGPSDWLSSSVTGLPDGTAPINNATGSDGRWEVNLSMPGANDTRLAQLATQLAWSLSDLTGQLDLKIQNQKRLTVDLKQERLSHPAYPTSGGPQRYCVYGGAIHPLSFAGEPTGTVPVAAAANKGVVSAGLGRSDDEILAALVVSRADRQRLMVGSGPDPVTVFNGSPWYGSVGRPVWLRSLDPQRPYGLVVADDKLYSFDRAAGMREVRLPVQGKVTAVAASLDGHRIALIIGSALYVAAVSLDGGVVSVGQPRRLVTTLTDVSAVDWVAENKLVFAGSEERRPAIYETSVDGALETGLEREIPAPRVTHLSAYPRGPAYPGGPVDGLPTGSYMYEANGVAYRNNPVETIKRDQVLDVTPPTPGGKASNPTAPFFLY